MLVNRSVRQVTLTALNGVNIGPIPLLDVWGTRPMRLLTAEKADILIRFADSEKTCGMAPVARSARRTLDKLGRFQHFKASVHQ